MVNWDIHVSFSDSRQEDDPVTIANIQSTLSDSLPKLVLLTVLRYIQLLGYWFFAEVILISPPI